MDEQDELDTNPLFHKLQNEFADLYDKAQEKCYLICIPQKDSLKNMNITQKFVETHILRPSPYFKGQYMCLLSREKTVQFEDDGKGLKTVEGFPQTVVSKILSEEQAYNKDYHPYRILVIDRPLDDTFIVTNLQQRQRTTSTQSVENATITFHECKQLLSKHISKELSEIEEGIKYFNTNYLILEEYLDDAKSRLQALCSSAQRKLPKKCKQEMQNDINSILEGYIVGSVHMRLFAVICQKYQTEDETLFSKCLQLEDVSPEKLGVQKEFICQQTEAIVELANLDALVTPIEKMQCLKNSLNGVTETIQSHVIDNHNPLLGDISNKDVPVLTSDDLIPILVTVIAKSKCQHLHSNIFYMENFHWSTEISERDNLSYCLVTFKVAVQYMNNTDFSHLVSEKAKAKKEISMSDLIKSTEEASLSSQASAPKESDTYSDDKDEQGSRSRSNIDKITSLFLKNTDDDIWGASSNAKPSLANRSVFGEEFAKFQPTPDVVPLQDPHREKNKKPKALGFLGTLEDDIFEQSFGKQT